jgi:hypothetical protein
MYKSDIMKIELKNIYLQRSGVTSQNENVLLKNAI